MTFNPPVWDSSNSHYVINLLPAVYETTTVLIKKDTNGSTTFTNMDMVENVTDSIIHNLIEEGAAGKWFTKLPSHDQLMKRVRHTFLRLAQESENAAVLNTLLLTPKQITLVWNPAVKVISNPQISFDSDSEESSDGDEVDVAESQLPPVELVDDSQETQEAYLLTRLRAAKARVEAEQIRMQYFEATGRMPPDSEDEDEDE
jgi:hypothetical protein